MTVDEAVFGCYFNAIAEDVLIIYEQSLGVQYVQCCFKESLIIKASLKGDLVFILIVCSEACVEHFLGISLEFESLVISHEHKWPSLSAVLDSQSTRSMVTLCL